MPDSEEMQETIDPARIHMLDERSIRLDALPGKGYVLDIGGGGEGVIGRLAGERVVAIDRSAEELAEAPGGYLKIVMDATDLKFLDESFSTVTIFFTLMYMPNEEQCQRTLAEVGRVLRPGGRLLIWDANLPTRQGRAEEAVAFPLHIEYPDGSGSDTGYGAPWPEQPRTADYYVRLAHQEDLRVVDRREQGDGVFSLELQRSL